MAALMYLHKLHISDFSTYINYVNEYPTSINFINCCPASNFFFQKLFYFLSHINRSMSSIINSSTCIKYI